MNWFRYLPLCALLFVPSLALADESLADWTKRKVEEGIVKPMSQSETHSFSRARPPPRQRRVRVTSASVTMDKDSKPFMRFAIDSRFGGGDWKENDVVGCAYTGSGTLYVKIGDVYRPAEFLLGKDAAPVAGVCEAPPPKA